MKKIITLALAAFLLNACASKNTDLPDLSVEQLYKKAYTYLQETDYDRAATFFDKIEQEYPYSIWAPRSQIMAAYTYYKANKYDDALLTLERFIQLHPGNKNIAYAYYLQGLCYYEQMSDISREQKMTLLAQQSFTQLIKRFPDSIYTSDVNQKFLEIESHLAGKEMDVGRYYLYNQDFIPALNRFQMVIDTYPRSKQTPEAFYRLTATYLSLGMTDKAANIAKTLSTHYPKNTWSDKANALLKQWLPLYT